MTLEQFNKERDERARQNWVEAWHVWNTEKPPLAADEEVTGFLIQWCMKDIAATQMMVEKLAEFVKMPPLDAPQ